MSCDTVSLEFERSEPLKLNKLNQVEIVLFKQRGVILTKLINKSGLNSIHNAARFGNIKQIINLLAHGNRVDKISTTGYTALQFAIYYKRREAVQFLLEKRANPYYQSSNGIGILHLLMLRYDKEIVKKFDRYNFDPEIKTELGLTPLTFILNSNNEVNSRLTPCCNCPNSDCSKTQPKECRIINTAKYMGTLDLLKRGANPNASNKVGVKAIHYAVEKGCPHLVRKLLEYGAEANPKPAKYYWSPLELAVIKKCTATIKVLLDCGANLDVIKKYKFRKNSDVKKIIDQHLIATHALGFKVNQVLMSKVEQNDEIEEFAIECYKQVDELKKIVLNQNNFTAYDLLRVSRRALVFVVASKNYDNLKIPIALRSAPIYRNMIVIKFMTAHKYAPILERATNSLNVIFRNRFDIVPLEKIASFLKYHDLKNIVIVAQLMTLEK